MKNKIKVSIGWTETNYSGIAEGPEVGGVVIDTHTDHNMLLKSFKETMEFHVEGLDKGDVPAWLLSGDYELEYHYTTAALLHKYEGILTRSALAKVTGINQRQLGHYATGHRKPRPAQRQKIVDAIRRIGEEFISVL